MLFSVYQFCLKCPRQEFDYVVNENHLDQTVQWWWRWITDFVMKTLFYQNNKYWKGILPFSVFCKPFNTCNQVHKFHCCYFLTREICVTKKKLWLMYLSISVIFFPWVTKLILWLYVFVHLSQIDVQRWKL